MDNPNVVMQLTNERFGVQFEIKFCIFCKTLVIKSKKEPLVWTFLVGKMQRFCHWNMPCFIVQNIIETNELHKPTLIETISPVVFLNFLSCRRKYQKRDLATIGSGEKILILYRGGLGSLSDGSLRPITSYSLNWK